MDFSNSQRHKNIIRLSFGLILCVFLISSLLVSVVAVGAVHKKNSRRRNDNKKREQIKANPLING